MNNQHVLITIFTEDRPGIVKALSDIILEHQGNWLESSFSTLAGQFAGIVHVEIAESMKSELMLSLEKLSEQNIHIHFPSSGNIKKDSIQNNNLNINLLQIHVEANDREGIVDEIATALSTHSINIIKIDTHCESASMAGFNLFKAELRVALPEKLNTDQLENILEQVSDDLMVSID